MWRYVIIGTALLAAFLVIALIKGTQRRKAMARGENLDDIPAISSAHLIGAMVGLLVLVSGVMLLESSASGPDGNYQPAKIVDGKITTGGFETDSAKTGGE